MPSLLSFLVSLSMYRFIYFSLVTFAIVSFSLSLITLFILLSPLHLAFIYFFCVTSYIFSRTSVTSKFLFKRLFRLQTFVHLFVSRCSFRESRNGTSYVFLLRIYNRWLNSNNGLSASLAARFGHKRALISAQISTVKMGFKCVSYASPWRAHDVLPYFFRLFWWKW